MGATRSRRVLGGPCRNGHLLTGDNATLLGAGYVRCKVCHREWERQRNDRQPRHYNRLGGVCKRNHLLTRETAVKRTDSGGWACIVCHDLAAAERREKKAAKRAEAQRVAAEAAFRAAVPDWEKRVG